MNIPNSPATVVVRIIETSRIDAPNDFVQPPIEGTQRLNCPSFAFLVEHPSGRKIIFDMGIRKDYENYPDPIQQYFQHGKVEITVEKDVHDQLIEHGYDTGTVEALIWSHWHWDHIGDPSTFPSSTALIVGPGFKETFVPGYPENPGSPILQTDYEGRELRELNFHGSDVLKIGKLDALDYFGDGSFYILDAPGHTIGHLCALARTTTSPDSFILMGADACHHSGEMRPSKWLPLPSEIYPHPLRDGGPHMCSGAAFEHLLRQGDRTLPFFGQKRPGLIFSDTDIAEQTIENLQAFDAEDNILVVIAHDDHLKGVVDFFPRSANDFMSQKWQTLTRWRFLSDFKSALLNEI